MMTLFDDPFAALEADSRRLAEMAEASAPEVARAAREIERKIARLGKALSARRLNDLRETLGVLDRRSDEEESELEGARARAHIVELEAEVEALLTSPGAARALYEARAGELERSLERARAARTEREAALTEPGATEMQRARAATAASAARDEEARLSSALASARSKAARLTV